MPDNLESWPGSVRFPFGSGPQRGPACASAQGMVSTSQHSAGRATDARHGPDTARFVAGTELRRCADRRPRWACGPGHVEHEKKTFFS